MSNGSERRPGSDDDRRDEVGRSPEHDADPATGPIMAQPGATGSGAGWSAPPTYYPPFSSAGVGPRPGNPDPASSHTPSTATAAQLRPRQGRGRLAAAGLALVVVAGGIGGGVATVLEHDSTNAGGTSSLSQTALASQPVAQAPNGTIAQVAAKVLPSIVQVQVSVGGSGEVGSGVVLSSDGNILTNNHVVEAAAGAPSGAITVVFQDGSTATASVVGRDPSADIAVIKVANKTGLTPITIGSSSGLTVGQNVVAIGSPLGLAGTVTSGIVSALNRPVSASGQAASTSQASVFDAIQTDAAINPGNSGGALVNMKGELIGINSAIASLGAAQGSQSGSIGLGFAIPIDHAQRIAQELLTNGVATQAVLGAAVTSAPTSTLGAVIGNVTPGSAAATAGLVAGDTITKVDSQVIDSSNALIAAVRSHAPGDTVTLTVTDHSGATTKATVTLGSQTVNTD